MFQQTETPPASVQPMPPIQTLRPAHCKQRFCSPRLLTEQLKQTCLPQAPQAVCSAALLLSTSISSASASLSPARRALPQSSHSVGSSTGGVSMPGDELAELGSEPMLQKRCSDCWLLDGNDAATTGCSGAAAIGAACEGNC